jgi:hypothetical protein
LLRDVLLIFAYHFPPENAIGGLRPFRFSKYLPRLGVRTRVFTAADVSSRPDLDAETVPDPFITHPRQGMGWQVERAIRKFALPGASGSQWSMAAYQAACRFIDHEGIRPTVLSTYPPVGTPFAGYWLAKKRGLPWILDLRDPMGDNHINSETNGFQQGVYRFLERTFVNSADCVIANTDAAQTRLKVRYPKMAGKINLLWNGFDPEHRLNPRPTDATGTRIYSHVGELYEGRVLTPLLLAMERLVRAGRVSPAKAAIQLVGPIRTGSVPNDAFMAAAQEKGWLRVRAEQVPQAEAQRIMQESDGLLLVQPGSSLQVPAKLYEYVQIGRPVLAYILPETPIERILRGSETACVYAYATGPAEKLEEALLDFFGLDIQAKPASPWFEQNFNTQHHAEQLLRLMRQINPSPSTSESRLAGVC